MVEMGYLGYSIPFPSTAMVKLSQLWVIVITLDRAVHSVASYLLELFSLVPYFFHKRICGEELGSWIY